MDLNKIQKMVHETATVKGFHFDDDFINGAGDELESGFIEISRFTDLLKRMRKNELLMLIVTEIAEACEAIRNNDDTNFAEELADTIIRCFDAAAVFGIDIEKEILRKNAINRKRKQKHGKVC